MKKALLTIAKYAVFSGGLCALVLFVANPVSCKMSEEGIQIVSTDRSAPQILSFGFKERTMLELVCTEAVSLSDVSFRNAADAEKTDDVLSVSYDETKTVARITLSEATKIGERYILSGVIEDINGNSLTFSLPFNGFNDNPAQVVFNEVRSEGSKKSPEFVELYVTKGGNLAGFVLQGGYDGKEKDYAFPPIDVAAGEYITVHYRHDSDTPDYCFDETGDDLTLAKAASNNDNCNTARDLFVPNADDSARIQVYDTLLVTSDNGTRIIDALLYAQSGTENWGKALQTEYAAKAASQGKWASPLPKDAACNDFATATRTLCRQKAGEEPSDADEWFVVKTSNATPGKPNSSQRYEAN